MARITALAELPERGGVEYAQGLRSAVEAAVAFAIEGMDHGERLGLVPEPLLAQARRAARSGVGLDTVLRRYVAGHALVGDFLVQEAEGRAAPPELKRALRHLAETLDTLLAAVTAAYRLEEQGHRRTAEQRRSELVERLLAGEPLDASELGYELEGHHLGLVSHGPAASEVLAALARHLDARLLRLAREEEVTWAWLGTREPLEPAEVCGRAMASLPPGATLAIGEPGTGPSGWRFTHRQARATLPVARRSVQACVRYGDVALLTTVVQDELLTTSLRRLYLEPLEAERDGGAALIETLQAYLAAEQNVSSAAAALGISRNTVTNRLRAIEERIGRPLASCGADLSAAVLLAELLTVAT